MNYTKQMFSNLERMKSATSEIGVEMSLKDALEMQPFALVEQLERIADMLDDYMADMILRQPDSI